MLVADAVFNTVYDRVEALVGVTAYGVTVTDMPPLDSVGTFSPQHGACILESGTCERFEAYDYPGNPPAQAWRHEYRIVLFVRDELVPTDWSRLAIAFAARVRKALTPTPDWYTLDGSAVDCEWGETTSGESDGGFRTVVVPLFVYYRHAEDDPEVQR